ncbi:MAG: hypothetical protein H6738_12625 [Alphaproteobacteria bacterium]|nr:hypothetical protein [Alphaproteobacteria bacterium]
MRVSVSEGGTMERSVAEELERHVDDGLYAVPEVHEWSEGCDCAHDPEQGCCNDAGTAGPKADVGAAQPASNRPQLGSGGDPPCEPDVSRGPPPWPASAQERVAWWGECTPRGPVGPGADGCDPDQVWWDALALCNRRCVEQSAEDMGLSVAEFLDRYESGCHDNAVDWAWVDEHCRVTDASCGYIAGNTGDPDWHVRQINQNASYDYYAQNQESAEQTCQQGGGTMVAYLVSEDGAYVAGWCMNLEITEGGPPQEDEPPGYESDFGEDTQSLRTFCDNFWKYGETVESEFRQNYSDCSSFFDSCGWPEELVGQTQDSCGNARDTFHDAEVEGGGVWDPLDLDDPCGPMAGGLC